jgi:hypothetical protein
MFAPVKWKRYGTVTHEKGRNRFGYEKIRETGRKPDSVAMCCEVCRDEYNDPLSNVEQNPSSKKLI